MEKDRDTRYQFAAELRADLKRLRRDMESNRRVGAAAVVASVTEAADEPSAAQSSRSSGSVVIAAVKQHRWAATAGVLVLLIVLGAAGLGIHSFLPRPAPMPFQKFTVTQVTNTGKAARAAISPDGKYVLSVMDDNGLASLWLRNVPTGSDTQVIAPSASHYESLAFSPDPRGGPCLLFHTHMHVHGGVRRLGIPRRLLWRLSCKHKADQSGGRQWTSYG